MNQILKADGWYDADTGMPLQSGAVDAAHAVDAAQQSGVAGPQNIQLFNNVIPTAQALDRLALPVGQSDIIYHEFYDSAAVTSGAANNITLFSSATSNRVNSNMSRGGQLGVNERFFMIGIRFRLSNTDTINPLDIVDTVQSLQAGYYDFKVSQKVYNSGLLNRFLDPEAPFVVNTKYYSVIPFITYKLPIPIAIGNLQDFSCEIVVTAGTLDATTRLYEHLCGFWYRNVQ